MQIEIADAVFATQRPRDLLAQIERAILFRHQVIPESWSGAGFITWVEKCTQELKEPDVIDFLKLQLDTSIFVHSRRSILVVEDARVDHTKGQFSFSDFSLHLLNSVFIYVENSRSDRKFILSIVPDKKIRSELIVMESYGALAFENSGGITELSNKIIEDSGIRPLLRYRAIAVFDSDATGPDEKNVSKAAKEAERKCRSVGVDFYRLKRRAIENYVPHACLLEFSDEAAGDVRARRKRMARAIPALTRDQQAFIHMKDGLCNNMAQSALYIDLPPDVKDALSYGFGPNLSSCFSRPENITEKRLKDSGMHEEVVDIVKFVLEYI